MTLERRPGGLFLKQTYKQPTGFYLYLHPSFQFSSPLKVLWHTLHCFLTLPTVSLGLTLPSVLNQVPLTFLLSCFQNALIAVYSLFLLSLCIQTKNNKCFDCFRVLERIRGTYSFQESCFIFSGAQKNWELCSGSRAPNSRAFLSETPKLGPAIHRRLGAELTALDFAKSGACKQDTIGLVHSLIILTFPKGKLQD